MFQLVLAAALAAPVPEAGSLTDRFIERYLAQYPSRATEAGRSDFDGRLEDLDPARLQAWLAFVASTDEAARAMQSGGGLSPDDALDLEVLRRALARERFKLEVRKAPSRDPLFWTGILSNAVIYLLLRDDQPLEVRVAALAARAREVPRLVGQAEAALGRTPPARMAPELAGPAAAQTRQLSRLYGAGLAQFSAPASARGRASLARSGTAAAKALEGFSRFLSGLERKATGSARLGEDYAEAFRIELDAAEAPGQLVSRFEEDLIVLRRQAAEYGRTVYRSLVGPRDPPAGDAALLRELFAAIEDRHDTGISTYAAFWEQLVPDLERLVRARQIISLPDPRTLKILPAPPWLLGQAYGGVFPAGPYRPEGETLLLLPVPPPDAALPARVQFFRAFNRPFSAMIAAHEALPGHYVQLKIAARQPRRIRALFPDGVYAEGWGTFVERLMLDHGWGGPAERIAHLKKQLENCARAIVDIRVQSQGMSREEVIRFVRDEGLQDPQLAENLWQRTLTSAPQLVTYHLGFRQFEALYRRAREQPGFTVRAFSDGVMRLGAVPLRHHQDMKPGQ